MPFCAISGYAKTLPLTASFPCVQPFPIGIFMSLNVQPLLWFAHKNYSLEGGLVRLAGIEPAWALARQILSLLCIPVPPQSRIGGALDAVNISDTVGFKSVVSTNFTTEAHNILWHWFGSTFE